MQASATSVAKPPVDASATVSDIVVTANRREEFAQRVGVSLTAATGAAIAQHNIQSAEDLQRIIPGLNATAETGTGVDTFVIRGVGNTDFNDHEEQPIATYQDGVYVPFGTAAGLPLFDLQRVEVLRGPQGTLFGRNATGGLIQYVSNLPTAGESAGLEAAYGSRNLYRLQGFLDDGGDALADRLSFYYQSQDGYLVNTEGRARGDKTVYSLRDQLLWRPNNGTTVTLRAQGFYQVGTSPGYISTPAYTVNGVDQNLPANVDAYGTGPGNDLFGYRNPYTGLKVALNDPGKLDKDYKSISATVDRRLGDATLTSISSFATVHDFYREDTDSTPIYEEEAGLDSRSYDLQQDLRVSGASNRFRYTAGLFYLYIDGRYSLYIDALTPTFDGLPSGTAVPAGSDGNLSNHYDLRTQSEALYGQAEYDLSDKWTIILGARYTWDQLRYNFYDFCLQTAPGTCAALYGGTDDSASSIVTGLGPLSINDSYGDWSGKTELNYKVDRDALIYASISKGVKGGGFTAPQSLNFPASSLEFRPETLYAFEIGEKAQFLNRRLTFNLSTYYYDYLNNQAYLFVANQTEVVNKDANAAGLEAELTAVPIRTVTATASAAYNYFEIHGVPVGDGYANERPNNAPRLQLQWGLSKSFDLREGYTFTLNYYGRYISAVYYNLIDVPIVRASPYSITDFTAHLDLPSRWYVQGNINNAFNRLNQVGAFDTTVYGFTLRQFGEPRTISLSVGTKF